MKRLLTILAVLPLILAGCHREPLADFVVSPDPAFVGEDINFTNLSSNTDYVEWEMGDGTTSSAFNVTHFYYDPGFYDVKLKAFGTKGGVSIASFSVEVIGSELTVVVQLWTPPGDPPGYYLEGASVRLYPTLADWDNQTNLSAELFTDYSGECTFEGLSYQRYYVDVWAPDHHNWWLRDDDVGFIETQLLEGAFYHTFIAYVDYDPGAKKSATEARPSAREMLNMEGNTNGDREPLDNKKSVPRK